LRTSNLQERTPAGGLWGQTCKSHHMQHSQRKKIGKQASPLARCGHGLHYTADGGRNECHRPTTRAYMLEFKTKKLSLRAGVNCVTAHDADP
jgi:hypothetical protein